MRQIISEAIARRLNDPRIAPLTTVTQVTMSRDLQIATVLISVPGPEANERRTLRALQHARGHLQRLVGQTLQLRHCPELRIDVDSSVRKARQTLRLIESNRADAAPERSEEAGIKPEPSEGARTDSPGDSPL